MIARFTPFPVLETPRLRLRAVMPDDAPELHVLRSDPAVLRYLDMSPSKSPDDALQLIEKLNIHQQNDESILWALAHKDGSDRLIGTICYWNLEPEKDRAELGYLLHPDYHGQGLMHESLERILVYGREVMQLGSVVAYTHGANEPSVKLLKRNGFVTSPSLSDGNVEYVVLELAW